MTKQTESKLNKVQRTAIKTLILDEYRAHRRDNDPKARNTQTLSSIRQATYKALERHGMLVRRNDSPVMDFTDIGRKAAIDLLHESAFEEMADAFEYCKLEKERKASESKIKLAIMKAYCLCDWEVEISGDYSLRDNALTYSIGLCQEREGRHTSPLVNISHSRIDGYYISPTGTSLITNQAKRMGELMLIAAKIVESGILS